MTCTKIERKRWKGGVVNGRAAKYHKLGRGNVSGRYRAEKSNRALDLHKPFLGSHSRASIFLLANQSSQPKTRQAQRDVQSAAGRKQLAYALR